MLARCLPLVLAFAAPGAWTGTQDGAAAVPPPAIDNSRIDRMQSELEALRRKTDEQAKQIEDLKAQNGEAWLTEQRASQIRGIVGDVLSDSSTRGSFRSDGATAMSKRLPGTAPTSSGLSSSICRSSTSMTGRSPCSSCAGR
jgi:hypothetical protein